MNDHYSHLPEPGFGPPPVTTQSFGTSLAGKLTFIASAIVLAVFILNGILVVMNRADQDTLIARQSDLAARATKIQQNATLENISRSLIQALATASITKKDEQIKALLIQNNVNLGPSVPPAGGSAK